MSRRKRAQHCHGSRTMTGTTNGDAMQSTLKWIVDEEIFRDLSFHGNTKWLPGQLVLLALAWVWSGKETLTDAFADARRWSTILLGTTAVNTYQGLAGALVTWTGRLMPLVVERIHDRMETIGKSSWRIGNWVPIAVDGSRLSLPRTRSHEAAFCAADYGHGKTAKYRKKKTKGLRRQKNERSQPEPPKPQMWVTLLWHTGLGLPWSWRLGPSNSSERHHCREMLDEENFPKNTLFCGDAGFVGYDFWKAIVDGGNNFLIRVGGNVKLLKKLGCAREREGIVYCWPNAALRRQQRPLVMRLIKLHEGRQPVYVVTSVLSRRDLSDRLAGQLYQFRWGIEVAFRGLKQTFRRRKLRSRRADRAAAEMEWSLVGLGIIQLLAVQQQIKANASPHGVSTADAIRVIRTCLEFLTERPRQGHDLLTHLREAKIDAYQRNSSKTARYKPKSYDKPTAHKPQILNANRMHKQQLYQLIQNMAA